MRIAVDTPAYGLKTPLGMEARIIGYKYVDHLKTKMGRRDIPLNTKIISLLNMVRELNEKAGYN